MARRRKSNAELEELTKTQVLNLQELQKAANFERKTSKKPAIILAIIGVFSISLGIFYPSINALVSDNNTDSTQKTISEMREESPSDDKLNNSMVCTTSFTNPDSTNTTLTYSFQFSDLKTLKFYTKEMSIKAITQLTQTPASIISLDTSLANLMQTPINGYLLEKIPIASTVANVVDGYTAKLSVDMLLFNPATLTPLHTSNSFANVEFNSTETDEVIKQKMISLGYKCQ